MSEAEANPSAAEIAAHAHEDLMHEKTEQERQRMTLVPMGTSAQKVDSVDGWKIYTLADAYADREPIEYAAGNLIEIPSISIIVAPPKSKKSLFAKDLALHIAAGKPWLPSGEPTIDGRPVRVDVEPIPIPHSRRTLWIDQDNGERRTADRLKSLGKGINAPEDTPISYLSMPQPPLDFTQPESVETLKKVIEDNKAEIVFIDTMGSIEGTAQENTGDMIPIMMRLRQVADNKNQKVAIILIHHEPKGEKKESDKIRGHSSIGGGVDMAYRIELDPNHKNVVTMRNFMARGPEAPDITAEFWYESDGNGGMKKCGFWGISTTGHVDLTYQSQCLCIYDLLNRNGPLNQTNLLKLATGIVMRGKKPLGRDANKELIERMELENKIGRKPGTKPHEFVYYKI